MHASIWKLTSLAAAVLVVCATNTPARAGEPEQAGVVRLTQIGDGAIDQTGGVSDICAPATSCVPDAAGCAGQPCQEKRGCCLSRCRLSGCRLSGCRLFRCCLGRDDDDCPEHEVEREHECDDDGCFCRRMLGLGGNGDGPWDAYGYGPYGSAAEARLAHLRCRFGYFIPSGDCGQGLPWAGHYGLVYPLNPDYFDPRDGRIYAAQGYGTPIATPVAPNVEFTYNYGWGIPSSRLTPLSRHVPGTQPITWPIPPGQRY